MAGSILGNAVLRLEDPRFLRGAATYIDNIGPDGVLRLDFVRSPFAHARIRSIDTSSADALEGVVATFTAESLGLAPHQVFVTVHDDFARRPLAVEPQVLQQTLEPPLTAELGIGGSVLLDSHVEKSLSVLQVDR